MVKRVEWRHITAAKDVLHLNESASLRDVKNAYRLMSKIHHPDLDGQGEANSEQMQAINDAYAVLMEYCENYRVPLVKEQADQPLDAEDWWMDRFGQDPLWSKKREG